MLDMAPLLQDNSRLGKFQLVIHYFIVRASGITCKGSKGSTRICPTGGLGSLTGGYITQQRVSFLAKELNFASKSPQQA